MGLGQHAGGRYNEKMESDDILVVIGKGTSNTARSNAHTLDKDGNAWFAGDVSVGANKQKLATEAYVKEHQGTGINDETTSVSETWSSQKISTELGKTIGEHYEGGGEIFNDYMDNIAEGNYSHAEGLCSEAYGEASHAEGNSSAYGNYSHSEGESVAYGDYSHAEGSVGIIQIKITGEANTLKY